MAKFGWLESSDFRVFQLFPVPPPGNFTFFINFFKIEPNLAQIKQKLMIATVPIIKSTESEENLSLMAIDDSRAVVLLKNRVKRAKIDTKKRIWGMVHYLMFFKSEQGPFCTGKPVDPASYGPPFSCDSEY